MNTHIFRSYDIRGVYGKDIDEKLFENIGNAFAQHVKKDIVLARDARTSSMSLSNAFMKGALDAEKTVMNIGELPLSVAIHWTVSQNMELAYITASHLGKEWNGVKFFHPNGTGFSEEENYTVRDIALGEKYFAGIKAVPVREEAHDVKDLYINHIASKIKASTAAGTKILVDCGNGTAGIIAKELFTKAGFSADIIFEQPDGSFPNRMSDPKEDPLTEMKKRIADYDFGIAYDGDADRVVIVTKSGKKLSTEQTAYVILLELLKHQKGPIVANVECSMILDDMANKFHTGIVRCRVGHTFLMHTVMENKASFGMESSGHFVIPFLTNFDDAISVSLYFAYALQKSQKPLEEILKEIPDYSFERIDFVCADERKFKVIEKIKGELGGERMETMDGIRVDYGDAWVLIRASNTSPTLRLTIEAKSSRKFEELKSNFTEIVVKNIG